MPDPAYNESPLDSEGVDQQLAAARAELEALEQAVIELPGIFEEKFRQSVAVVGETNRQLVAQQVLLHRELAALDPSGRLRVTAWPTIRLPRLQLPGFSVRQLVVVLLSAVGVVLVLWRATHWLQSSPGLQARHVHSLPQVHAFEDDTLVLRARDTSWVEVQELSTRKVILIGLLEPGQQRQIRLRQGLRIRSGRPDLLSIQIGKGPQQPFGDDLGLGWRTFKRAGA